MKWLIFITVAVWLLLIFNWATGRRQHMRDRMTSYALQTNDAKMKSGSNNKRRTIWQWARFMSRRFVTDRIRLSSGRRMEQVQMKLAQAGNPRNLTMEEWVGIRLIAVLVGVAGGSVLLWLSSRPLLGLIFLLAGSLLGWIGPEFWLSRRLKVRTATLLRQFPSALDLLTVSVEAGLGFDQAMARVAEKMHGPLPEEFERALREVQLGSPRSLALQRLAKRTGVDAVTSFVSAVVQAEKLGVGIAQVLRVQSTEVRRKRRMDASERAIKAPVKMLFPLIFFVFPSLFIIILGPAVLHFIHLFHHIQ